MQLIRDICSRCSHLLPIVNMKYYLCDNCNFQRLNYGKTKEEVYRERIDQRARTKFENLSKKKSLHQIVADNAKKPKSISKVSTDKKYYCSDGTMVSQAEIQMQLKIVYARIKEVRLPVCEGLDRNDLPLSMSHTISQARCKELRKTELIWDEDNIFVESFEAPTSNPEAAHNIWEVSPIEKKMTLLNFKEKLAYIKIHDPEEFNRLEIKMEEFNKRKRE